MLDILIVVCYSAYALRVVIVAHKLLEISEKWNSIPKNDPYFAEEVTVAPCKSTLILVLETGLVRM